MNQLSPANATATRMAPGSNAPGSVVRRGRLIVSRNQPVPITRATSTQLLAVTGKPPTRRSRPMSIDASNSAKNRPDTAAMPFTFTLA